MNLALALLRDGEAIEVGRHDIIHHQALNSADQLIYVARQLIEKAAMLARRRKRRRTRVEFENVSRCC
jgi:hypothetical protein